MSFLARPVAAAHRTNRFVAERPSCSSVLQAAPLALVAAFVSATPLAAGCGSTKTAGHVTPTRPDSSQVDASASAPPVAAPYTISAYDNVRISSKSSDANFQKAVAEIDFHDGPFEAATLVVDLASTCYPLENRAAPPPGQSWPADCDAFDRNFDIHLDEPAPGSTPTAKPGLEVMHAITPFGGPLHREIDITDIANGLAGKHTLTTHITTWSDGAGKVSGSNGGWNVSARIDLTPGAPPRAVLAVVPLLDTSVEKSDGISALTFTTPPGTTSARLEVRTSGHGGGPVGSDCIGPAEEFCKRTHTWTLDGAALATRQAWRTDCAKLCTLTHYGPPSGGFDYCKENPCGDIRSVKASRANWCPGSETPPFVFESDALSAPGTHSIGWAINKIEGGNWTASATYFAFGDAATSPP